MCGATIRLSKKSLYRSETVTSRVQIFKICDLDHIASSRSRCTRDGTLSLLWLKSSAARGRGMKKVKGFGFTGIAALAFLFAVRVLSTATKQKASKATAKATVSGRCPRTGKTKGFKIHGKNGGGQVHVAASARRAISGQRNLQDLSRGCLQRMGEDAPLENDAGHQGRSLASGMRRVPRAGLGPRGRRRRRHQNLHVQGCLDQRDHGPLHDLPRGGRPAYERPQFGAHEK